MKRILTEQEIRLLLKKDESIQTLDVPRGAIVTPSALEFLKMSGVALNFTDGEENAPAPAGAGQAEADAVYYGPGGEKYDTKPEELTHLCGNRLTEKDDPVIVFRGKLDTLCAQILEAQLLGARMENRAFVKDLQEVILFTRTILPAEYKGNPLGEFRILGLGSRELRERSQHPDRYFGRKHLLMDFNMGPLCIRLNLLRTVVREAELAAITAFRDPAAPSKSRRADIVEALNRLSSLFYILMYKYLPRDYSPSGSAGI